MISVILKKDKKIKFFTKKIKNKKTVFFKKKKFYNFVDAVMNITIGNLKLFCQKIKNSFKNKKVDLKNKKRFFKKKKFL